MDQLSVKNALLAFTLYRAYRIVFPKEIKSMTGKVCLVTGAGGGLGLAIVKELRSRNCGKLILWDIKQDVLDAAKKEAGVAADVETRVVDMSKKEKIYEAIDELSVLPHYVFNVAGIVSGKYVTENSDDVDNLTFQVNTLALLWMTKALLPKFEKRGEGHFVNVASMAAFVGAAGLVSYSASKAGAMMLSQALNHELANRGSPIKVTCVCPSHFSTPLFDGFKFTANLTMTPEYVAYRCVEGALAERELVCLPQYLIPMLPILSLWQVNGYLNAPNFERSNPMAHWGGSAHANERFAAMGAKL